MLNIFIFLFCYFFFCACHAADMEEPKKLFKIGLELQESNHLCPWGIDEEGVQNTPIFSVQKGGRHLWDITIDWQDLEFVTSPFSNLEEESFNSAIESIRIACDTLSELNSESGMVGAVTFKKWRTRFQQKLNTLHPDQYIVSFEYKGDSDALGSLIFPPTIEAFVAKFQPQVTIQHKLSQSIPLILGLCSSSLTMKQDDLCLSLNGTGTSLLVKDTKEVINEIVRECFSSRVNAHQQFIVQKETSPEEGFLFLHMLTCSSLVTDIDTTQEESRRIEKVLEWYKEGGQVNAKAFLGVLSRRPFSKMWQDIRSGQLYSSLVDEQVKLEFRQSLSERFRCINYGELYFHRDGTRQDLTPHFPDLVRSEVSKELLENGVLSTSMLRQSSDHREELSNVFISYFNAMIASIDGIESQYYDIDSDTIGVRQQQITYDLLSPPHFSSTYNSMGAYKEDKHDPAFGEAILEFRMIANIGEYARTQIEEIMSEENDDEVNIRAGEFLSKTIQKSKITQKSIYALQGQAKGLFVFMKTLFELGVSNEI